jgi:hypothetical protein
MLVCQWISQVPLPNPFPKRRNGVLEGRADLTRFEAGQNERLEKRYRRRAIWRR